jgi:hypothetical protein
MSKRAARPQGGLIAEPPISQGKASSIMEQQIPDVAWEEIRRAFHEHGRRLRALEASKLSRSKGDGQSWQVRKTATTKSIEAAMAKLEEARSRHGAFLEEASDLSAEGVSGRSSAANEGARRLLDEALAKMLCAVTILERADPEEIETPTAAHARDLLVKAIRDALTAQGIGAKASAGFDLDLIDKEKEKVKLGHLTAFERLIAGFLIGDDKAPSAFSAWIRGALTDGEK